VIPVESEMKKTVLRPFMHGLRWRVQFIRALRVALRTRAPFAAQKL
jgi:hypothetical protein